MKIILNKSDIRNGKKSCTACPIANALKRHGFKDVHVSYGEIRADRNVIGLPSHVLSFMHAFDTDRRPDPIEFDLPLSN